MSVSREVFLPSQHSHHIEFIPHGGATTLADTLNVSNSMLGSSGCGVISTAVWEAVF